MESWQAVLLAVGGLAFFVLLLFGTAKITSGFLGRDQPRPPKPSSESPAATTTALTATWSCSGSGAFTAKKNLGQVCRTIASGCGGRRLLRCLRPASRGASRRRTADTFRGDDMIAITGSGGGIGNATARLALEAGAKVVAGDVNLLGTVWLARAAVRQFREPVAKRPLVGQTRQPRPARGVRAALDRVSWGTETSWWGGS